MMFDWLKTRLVEIVKWFADLWVSIFVAIWDVVKDGFSWLLEQLLSIIVSAMNTVDVSGLAGYMSSWGDLPGEIINVMGLLGFGTAASIIIAACTIRLVLQLIPFVRLGS